MEEIERLLNTDNPITVAQVVSRITKNVVTKHSLNISNITELSYLKEKCVSASPLISHTFGMAIAELVEKGVLKFDTTLAEFISMIPTTKNSLGLVKVIGNLLYIQMNQSIKDNQRVNIYNLSFPQHPYVTFLNENSAVQFYIFNEIRNMYIRNTMYAPFVTELFKPVYIFTFCNPTNNQLVDLKQRLWSYLLNLNKIESFDVILLILSKMQIHKKSDIEPNNELLCDAVRILSTKATTDQLEILVLWQISFLYWLAVSRSDMTYCLTCLKEILSQGKKMLTVNSLILILAKTVKICPPVHLEELLELCKTLINYENAQNYALKALKSSLLQWISTPSDITSGSDNIISGILNDIKHRNSLESPKKSLKDFFEKNRHFILGNTEIYISVQLCLLSQSTENFDKCIDYLHQTSLFFLQSNFTYICGLFLEKHSTEQEIKLLNLLLKCVEGNNELSSDALTLILYKLSHTQYPDLHFNLMKSIPKMVVIKQNMPKVTTIIQALGSGSSQLHNFGIHLMFDAWKTDNRYYCYLEKMLLGTVGSNNWENNVTKAYILKGICEKRPELYGKDLVGHLSKILNENKDFKGDLPCSFALEAIKSLCKVEIIDVVTTWATLAPKFKNDQRVRVIKSLCSLIGEIPSLPYTDAYPSLIEEVMKTLWEYVSTSDKREIVESAFNAMTYFSLECINSHIPDDFLDEVSKETREISKNISGKTWTIVLSKSRFFDVTSDFISKMVAKEIASYLKAVYHVQGSREPINYKQLPTESIVRGLMGVVKQDARMWKNGSKQQIFVECVKILSKEYSKPLPPIDLSFLLELMDEIKLRDLIFDLASHQVMLSGTARKKMENCIVEITKNPNTSDIENVYRNLKYLANSIQPAILKPFFENSLSFLVVNYKKGDVKCLINVVNYIKNVLKNPDVQETNKITLADVLIDLTFQTELNSELFSLFLDCLALVSQKGLEKFTKMDEGLTDKEKFIKIVKIRCCKSKDTTKASSLNFLNSLLQFACKTKWNSLIFPDLIQVFKHQINNTESALWLLDLFGLIQAKVAERCDESEIIYFCDILILAVDVFSGHFVFELNELKLEDKMKDLFPQALFALLDANHWSICTIQALEWLYHMNREDIIPKEYQIVFGQALCCLRHDAEFVKNYRWMKYLNCNIYNQDEN